MQRKKKILILSAVGRSLACLSQHARCIRSLCAPWCTCAKLLQSCVTVTCSLPGSSVHGILQARILAWIAMPSSRGSSPARDCLLHWQLSSLPLGPPGKPVHNDMVLICKHSKEVYSLSWFHYYWHYDVSEACMPRLIPWWKPENHP